MIVESHIPTSLAAPAGSVGVVRVAASPLGHPYLRGIAPVASASYRYVEEPVAADRPPGQWWPPVIAHARWVRDAAASFDLMHLHFGLESLPVDRLSELTAALADAGKPLVFTVHDLQNPQLLDQSHHRAQLDVLIPAAAELITLTAGAAREIEAGWGRTATVVPHPRMLSGMPRSAGTPPVTGPRVIGLHLRDLRANVDAVGATGAFIAAVRGLRRHGVDAVGMVYLNAHVRDEVAAQRVEHMCAVAGSVAVIRRPRPSDDDLADELIGLDVAVLPYSFGTHSGWLELCWDLGTPVASPRVGYLAEQHPDDAFVQTFVSTSGASLAQAVERLIAPAIRSDRARVIAERRIERTSEHRRIVERHTGVYASALAHRSGS